MIDCKVNGLHDYEIIGENEHVKVETCKLCGKTERFNKDSKGRADPKKYLKAHKRDFLQPGGRTGKEFKEVYGEKAIDQLKRKI